MNKDGQGVKLTKAHLCKGCGLGIEPGQLRRGDDWHADCFSSLERKFVATRPKLPKARRGLTSTQVFILEHALAGPILMGAGDRRGTRCVGYEEATGAAVIKAYCNPAYFLQARGLLRPRNQLHYYDITPAGRAALEQPQ